MVQGASARFELVPRLALEPLPAEGTCRGLSAPVIGGILWVEGRKRFPRVSKGDGQASRFLFGLEMRCCSKALKSLVCLLPQGALFKAVVKGGCSCFQGLESSQETWVVAHSSADKGWRIGRA